MMPLEKLPSFHRACLRDMAASKMAYSIMSEKHFIRGMIMACNAPDLGYIHA